MKERKIKLKDYYACKFCHKTCMYSKITKKNYPYCRRCKGLTYIGT